MRNLSLLGSRVLKGVRLGVLVAGRDQQHGVRDRVEVLEAVVQVLMAVVRDLVVVVVVIAEVRGRRFVDACRWGSGGLRRKKWKGHSVVPLVAVVSSWPGGVEAALDPLPTW